MFKILTETTCDFPEEYYAEHGVIKTSLSCIMNGITYNDENPIDLDTFYSRIRSGELPTTSQINPDDALRAIEKTIETYDCDVLVIAFSSGLSGTYNSFRIAKEEYAEKDSKHKVIVVDSLCASMGEGLLVHKAVCLQKEGKSIEEVAQWIEEHKLNIVHNFTVSDLFHLHRGGRVSKATAIVGTLANIKPVLHVDNEGKLVAVGNARGRKRSITSLVDAMENQIGSYKDENDIIFISHGDCLEEAKELAKHVENRLGYKNFMFGELGPVIGSHAGPGTLALFYLGDYRQNFIGIYI